MDKKNVLLGILFLAAGLGMMIWSGSREATARREAAEQARHEASRTVTTEPRAPELSGTQGPAGAELRAAGETDGLARAVEEAPELPEEALSVLENEYMRAAFTNRGGTLHTVTLKDFPAEQGSDERVVLHELATTAPLSLARASGDAFLPLSGDYRLVGATDTQLVYETTLSGGLLVRRIFSLETGGEESPANYTIDHRIEVSNPTGTAFNFDDLYINIGSAAPTNADPYGFDLNGAFMDDGDYDNIPASKFKGGGFLFFGSGPKDRVVREGSVQWGAVKNQFFASILTPEERARSIVALPVEYPRVSAAAEAPVGVTAYLRFSLPTLAAGESTSLSMEYYSGPKDFQRLSAMGEGQEDVMHLGWFMFFFIGIFAFVGKLLLALLTTLHGWIGNWGWAIIVLTLIVRGLLWPLTAKAARASKRMQELSKPMQEIKEKYKDNPQKQQQETIQLFRKHKVNPMSGCWPVLLQFPIFIAMFNLLRNTADLRFAHFLWIDDLSMPDATIPLGSTYPLIGSAINVLPFVWLASMYFQMRMMPQPSIDNAQIKIVRFMPFIFFPFTYLFSSGLVLYWTTTNCFSIFQGWVTRRTRDAEDIAIEAEIAEKDQKKGAIQAKPLRSKKKKKKQDGSRR